MIYGSEVLDTLCGDMMAESWNSGVYCFISMAALSPYADNCVWDVL
jgi:hypothetical protein